jgi:hypothetical protein
MDIPENNSLFKKLGLTKSTSLELSMTAEEFKEKFKSRVGSETNFFGFSGHHREFHGQIKQSTFKISRSSSFLNNTDLSAATGSYQTNDDKVIIQVMAYAPMTWIVLSSIIILFISTIPLIVTANQPSGFVPAIIICSATLLMFFPLFVIFPHVRKLKKFLYDLEREFITWQVR